MQIWLRPTFPFQLPLPRVLLQRRAIRERHRVHTIAKTGGRRTIIEDMAEMRAASCAGDFRSKNCRHSTSGRPDRCWFDRFPETWPAGAGIEFRRGAIKWIAAGGADIGSRPVLYHVAALGGTLSSGAPHDMELRRRKDRLPFIIPQMHFLPERNGIEPGANSDWVEVVGPRARAGKQRETTEENDYPSREAQRIPYGIASPAFLRIVVHSASPVLRRAP